MTLDQSFTGRVYPPTAPYEVGREKISEFADAIKVAKASDTSTVIHVETDPLIGAPDSESWWDVPVSATSELESTKKARTTYESWKKIQRPYLRPSE